MVIRFVHSLAYSRLDKTIFVFLHILNIIIHNIIACLQIFENVVKFKLKLVNCLFLMVFTSQTLLVFGLFVELS